MLVGRIVGRLMARSINKLSARTVDTVKKHGLLADGGGLYLQVGKAGAKSWLFRFTLNSRTRFVVRGPLRAFPGTWSMSHVPWILLRGPKVTPTFAKLKIFPYLGLNIKYGIYPLYDGVA